MPRKSRPAPPDASSQPMPLTLNAYPDHPAAPAGGWSGSLSWWPRSAARRAAPGRPGTGPSRMPYEPG
jgi:hypothetical protein